MATRWRERSAAVLLVSLGSLTVPAVLGQQPPPSPATGAISGVVINGATKAAIADALVEVGWPGQREFPEFVKPQLTDARGRFAFTGLPSNTVITVRAVRTGFMVSGGASVPAQYGTAVPVVLKDGEWFPSATVALWPPASISGTVRDERGEPLIGIYVRLLAQVRAGSAMRWAAGNVVLTDDRGVYRIGMLAAGTYLVVVPSVQSSLPASATAANTMDPETSARYRDQGRPLPALEPMVNITAASRLLVKGYPVPPPPEAGRVFTYPITFAGGTTVAGATPITIAAGEERTAVDVTLAPVPAAEVSGTVEGPGDSRANVYLRLLVDGLDEMGLGSEAATTLTRPDGSFVFPTVPAGAYVIEAPLSMNEFVIGNMAIFYSPMLPTPPGLRGGGRTGGGVPAPGFGFIESPFQSKVWGRTRVTVSAAGETGVTVALEPALTVSGRLVTEASPNRPPPQTPPRFLHIQSASGSARIGTTYNRESARANDGTFQITGLLPGAYLFYSDDRGWLVKSVIANGRDHTHTPLHLESSLDEIVVTFTNDPPTLSGTVTGVDPARPGSVLVYPAEPAQWTDYGLRPRRIRTERLSTAGTFTISNLPAGSYNVIALPADRIHDWLEAGYFQRAQALATRVTLNWGERHSTTLSVKDVR